MKTYGESKLHYNQMVKLLTDFSEVNGAMEVHRAWRDTMLEQGRPVSPERMKWSTLSEEDKELDREIAMALLTDFVEWLYSHPHG